MDCNTVRALPFCRDQYRSGEDHEQFVLIHSWVNNFNHGVLSDSDGGSLWSLVYSFVMFFLFFSAETLSLTDTVSKQNWQTLCFSLRAVSGQIVTSHGRDFPTLT